MIFVFVKANIKINWPTLSNRPLLLSVISSQIIWPTKYRTRGIPIDNFTNVQVNRESQTSKNLKIRWLENVEYSHHMYQMQFSVY